MVIEKLRVLDLFSGIGGFSLGLERTGGFETVAFCEIEDYPRRVLAKHWPDVPIYEDVRNVTASRLAADAIDVDVITGGFPCQDISISGRQAGLGNTRSGLWTELCRIICEVRPQYAIVENVTNLLSGPTEQRGGWFGVVLGDLAEIGYDAEWHCISAAHISAPHARDRVWIVAYPRLDPGLCIVRTYDDGEEGKGGHETVGHKNREQPKLAQAMFTVSCEWPDKPNPSRMVNGISDWVDRLKGLGNAVVPQIPEMIGYAILDAQ